MKYRGASDEIPKAPEWGDQNYKDIVRDKYLFQENLPQSIVRYPDVYGTWISFQESPDATPYFCECSRRSMVNFLRLEKIRKTHYLAKGTSLAEHFLPSELSAKHQKISNPEEFEESDLFRPKLCHMCNLRVPSVRWSNLGEHSVFLQHFGWYWCQRLLDNGIDWIRGFLPEECPDHIRSELTIDPWETYSSLKEFADSRGLNIIYSFEGPPRQWHDDDISEAHQRYRQMLQVRKNVECLIEEELRYRFGFPKRGKTMNHETILFLIIKAIFPEFSVVRHARPKWISPLTIDIFVAEKRLAIEFQGIQHFKPMQHLGGNASLERTIERDKEKLRRCRENGVNLVYFDDTDKLTESYVKNKLSQQVAVDYDH